MNTNDQARILRDQYEKLKASNTQLTEANSQLTEANTQLTKTNTQLQQDKDAIQADIAELKEAVRYRSEVANKVGKDLEDLKNANKTRAVASPFGPPRSGVVLFPPGYDGRN